MGKRIEKKGGTGVKKREGGRAEKLKEENELYGKQTIGGGQGGGE